MVVETIDAGVAVAVVLDVTMVMVAVVVLDVAEILDADALDVAKLLDVMKEMVVTDAIAGMAVAVVGSGVI